MKSRKMQVWQNKKNFVEALPKALYGKCTLVNDVTPTFEK